MFVLHTKAVEQWVASKNFMSYDGSAIRESKYKLEEAHAASLATDTGSGKRESYMMQITQHLRTEVSLRIIGFIKA